MKPIAALEGGLAGAFALSLLHEILRHNNPDAPHMDELGMQALSKTLNFANLPIPGDKKLFLTTLAADIFANTAFYSAIGIGTKNQVWLRGVLIGLSAGIGGVVLPKPLGLKAGKSSRTTQTKILTMALYLAGGLVASAVMQRLERKYK